MRPEFLEVHPERRPLSYLELQEAATSPPTNHMRLVHRSLPWYIVVQASNGNIITISHLLWTLYFELHRMVYEHDFWNEDVEEGDRRKIHDAWAARCQGDPDEALQGVKRVDFFGEKVIFEGFRKKDDEWEIKVRSQRHKP